LQESVDLDTTSRFRLGDREAFLVVYAAYAPTLRMVVSRYFPRPFDREEAVQEVWLLIHRMAASFDPDRGTLSPWLRTVATNRCKELLRARGRRPDPRKEVSESDIVTSTTPESVARDGRVQEAIARFSKGLSADEAQVFQHSLLEERTHDEVAAVTGLGARRCKYLRMKLLLRAAADPALRQALGEVTES